MYILVGLNGNTIGVQKQPKEKKCMPLNSLVCIYEYLELLQESWAMNKASRAL